MEKLIESLSPNELKILPHLEDNLTNICKKSNLDKVAVIRAIEYLKNKGIANLNYSKKTIIEIGVNGALYKTRGLPERRLLNLLAQKRIISLEDAPKQAKLSDDEFKISIGVLKKKALIEIKNKKIILSANKEEISKKTLEEIFIEALPLNKDGLTPEQAFAFKALESRKEIIEIATENILEIEITELGKKLMQKGIQEKNRIEVITPQILRDEKKWKGKKFRRYDVTSPVPEISGGKRHFVHQATDYARKIWTQMGFEEMRGDFVQSSFWNFDALFTPQDHPVREMQDTFFIDKKLNLPEKKIANAVRTCHEKGVGGSRGWNYSWKEDEAKKAVLRTHTTCLSAQMLAKLKSSDLPKKFFSIGKVFRNETIDWSHGFEFYQTEGIVVDKDTNFKHLLGYLKQFYKKMGFEKIRFAPAYFPYTEPSVEIHVWHPEKKTWLELGGAGIFRPELTIPLMGSAIPVLAWGIGFDRIITDYYDVKDLRELYKNDFKKLKQKRYWVR